MNQEWLSERDMVLSSHLDHDLTVDDLPDETQVKLEFSIALNVVFSFIIPFVCG